MIRVNPQYRIRNDKNCSFIVRISEVIDPRVQPWLYDIHEIPPILGGIFSEFNGTLELSSSLKSISSKYGITESILTRFIQQLIDNESVKRLQWEGKTLFFPPYFLTKSNSSEITGFTSCDFVPTDQFIIRRPSSPINLNVMITTRCKTDCLYCYADRNRKDDLDTSSILRLLQDARNIGVINLTLTGGDVIAHSRWRDIIELAYKSGYRPFISTKVPLTEDDVLFLKALGVNQVQFSLDSCKQEVIYKLIKRGKSYLADVLSMFTYSSTYDLKMSIRTVLTKFNHSSEHLSMMLEILSSYPCVSSWTITPAFYSEYRDNFESYSLSTEELLVSENFLKIASSKFPIYSLISNRISTLSGVGNDTKEAFLQCNKICSANSYSASILSNGVVTICEMLYHNPTFIIGNIRTSSLDLIWNSPRALEIYNGDIYPSSTQSKSPCSQCEAREVCKGSNKKKVCYVDICKNYPENLLDYPDPMCPLAQGVDFSKIM